MNWLLMVVGGIFLICIIVGLSKGAIRIAVSLLTTILTLILVSFATPYVAKTIEKYTPMDEMIKSQLTSTAAELVTSELFQEESNGAKTMDADSVRKVLKAAGVSEEKLKEYGITVEDIVNGSVSSEDLAQYGISGSVLAGLNSKDEKSVAEALDQLEIPKEVQNKAIESVDIPAVYKELLVNHNNEEIYSKLGAETFPQYVGNYLAKLIINMIAFLGTFILVTIIVRAIVFALDIVAELPVLGFVNRLAGGLAGMVGALIIVWTIFLLITLLYTTNIGRELYLIIQSDPILKTIYNYNPILKLAVSFIK